MAVRFFIQKYFEKNPRGIRQDNEGRVLLTSTVADIALALQWAYYLTHLRPAAAAGDISPQAEAYARAVLCTGTLAWAVVAGVFDGMCGAFRSYVTRRAVLAVGVVFQDLPQAGITFLLLKESSFSRLVIICTLFDMLHRLADMYDQVPTSGGEPAVPLVRAKLPSPACQDGSAKLRKFAADHELLLPSIADEKALLACYSKEITARGVNIPL
mmetsp:Transcript_39609/g.77454  ORF Transcript_39609/g.77454 Transcript_39609/m.77454 type:complete len:213 (+) Transcript_39609:67-705(+)|eukprot:CAMPEP_0194322686 /NCGR_PEP_ID=MMETSP0171-20130528/22214_1 /TAXON_ID=218684 /ORGANISM="Corethron pennatum, Strain L29A3" /LENGTH=212 /DNA_ID=CAMNT_0039081037 /DNA_START=40 /DNA_END=678 /DNA_ORIENTATION=+